jgi:hypothetical protein
MSCVYVFIIIIIIIFLRGLGRLTCSGIDALPSFPGASTVSSSSRFVVEGVFRQSGVVRSFKAVDPCSG